VLCDWIVAGTSASVTFVMSEPLPIATAPAAWMVIGTPPVGGLDPGVAYRVPAATHSCKNKKEGNKKDTYEPDRR